MQKSCSLVSASILNKQEKTSLLSTNSTNLIKSIMRRSSEIRDQVITIKLPSAIIASDELLTNFAENVQLLSVCGAKIFIVHDYVGLVEEALRVFGLDEEFVSSIKLSDCRSTQIIEMVLSGYINKLIVSKLCKAGCCAIGISGKDGNLIRAKKPKLAYTKPLDDNIIDLGCISQPVMVNPEILLNFEESEIIPVISPIASDENDRTHLLDVNLTAALIASSLEADHLIIPCEELISVEANLKITDPKLLVALLKANNRSLLASSLIEAAISAVNNHTDCVHFVKALAADSILLSILSDNTTSI